MNLPGYDRWLESRAPQGIPDETCQLCLNAIGDDTAVLVQMVSQVLVCLDCAKTVERCDQCHFLRCRCEMDR